MIIINFILNIPFFIGWWYVCSINSNEGWLPSTILELRGTTSLHTKRKRDLDIIHYPSDVFVKQISCHASKSYQASQYDELSIKAGDWVKVLYESPSGWWTIKLVIITELDIIRAV